MFIVHHSLQKHFKLSILFVLDNILRQKRQKNVTLSFYIWEIWVTFEGHRSSMSELELELKEPELFQDSFSSG